MHNLIITIIVLGLSATIATATTDVGMAMLQGQTDKVLSIWNNKEQEIAKGKQTCQELMQAGAEVESMCRDAVTVAEQAITQAEQTISENPEWQAISDQARAKDAELQALQASQPQDPPAVESNGQ